ncbi:MAG: hypothetical protein ACK4GD_08935 [Sphingomonadaceae bacterium]
MTSETDNAAPATQEAGTDHKSAHAGSDKLAAWSALALVTGLAGDIAKPVGNYSIWLLALGVLALAICISLRRFTLPRRAILHSSIFSAIMATIVALQYFSPEERDASERGFAAAYVPLLAAAQPHILPLTEAESTLLSFKNAISRGTEQDRQANARTILNATEDLALRRSIIEELARSSDAGLRQTGILYQLASRRGDRFPLMPINRDANDVLTRRLLSYSVRINSVNTDTGALDLSGDGWGSNGTVSRQGISMQVYIDMPDTQRESMLVELALNNELKLLGTARLDDGQKVPVEMPLF